MRKLLIFSPLNIVLTTFVMVIVLGRWSTLKIPLKVDFLGLTKPFSGWFSPSVVILKEHVVQVRSPIVSGLLYLVKLWRNVRELNEVLGTYLGYVEVNQMRIEAVNVIKRIFRESFSIKPTLDMNTLMWKDYRRVPMCITRTSDVKDL